MTPSNTTPVHIAELSPDVQVPTVAEESSVTLANYGDPTRLTNDQLAEIVIDSVKKFRSYLPYIRVLKERFDSGDRDSTNRLTVPISGCFSWKEFCSRHLGRTDRAVRKVFQEKTAASNYKLPPWQVKCQCGETVQLARSAVQKAVRDGNETAACYWIRQLYFAYGAKYVWKAIFNFVSEDIGLADLTVKNHCMDLHTMAEKLEGDPRGHHPDLLNVLEAIMLCCRAKKSRATDNAAMFFEEHPTYKPPTEQEVLARNVNSEMPEIPDKVFDKHVRGNIRSKGRGNEHFKANAVLTNESDVAPFIPPVLSHTIQQDADGLFYDETGAQWLRVTGGAL